MYEFNLFSFFYVFVYICFFIIYLCFYMLVFVVIIIVNMLCLPVIWNTVPNYVLGPLFRQNCVYQKDIRPYFRQYVCFIA